jgi:predicted O-methyltransferase YrrM
LLSHSDVVLPRVQHRPPTGWRSRHLFGALRLRPPAAQHSLAEAALLKRYGTDATTVVELGVAEGGSAAELRSVMSARGCIYLVDPYEPGSLGISLAQIIARRTVGCVRNGEVRWIRARSDDAVKQWSGTIDFLFIDADHSYERARSDWDLWTPFVQVDGRVALHDSVVFSGGWTDQESGPVRLVAEIVAGGSDWEIVDQADSMTVMRRKGIDVQADR